MSPSPSSPEEEIRRMREDMAKLKMQNEEFARDRAQAEARAQKAEREKQEEALRADGLQIEVRASTLEELLQQCHEQLFQGFAVQTDKTLTTKGGTTDPTGKIHPRYLRQWADFPEEQQNAFDRMYGALYNGKPDDYYRLFLSRANIEGLAKTKLPQKAGSEMDLRLFQNHCVESIVTNVIQQLSADADLATILDLHKAGVKFENHSNALRDGAADVQARQQSLQTPVTPPNPSTTAAVKASGLSDTNADQLCVYHTVGDRKKLLYVMEYKAPHKFTNLILRQGFREMDVAKEVINQVQVSQDEKGKFRDLADYLVAAAATQTYAYMLESKCEYGCLVTGESIVFLRLNQRDPSVLEYRLTEPAVACAEATGGQFPFNQTAIAQMLSFFFMALQSKLHTNEWMEETVKRAPRWQKDVAAILDAIPSTIRKSPPLSPAYEPPNLSDKVMADSPYYQRRNLRQRGKQLPPPRYGNPKPKNERRHDEPDDSDPFVPPGTGVSKRSPDTHTTKSGNQQGGGKKQGAGKKAGNWETSDSDAHYYRPYCTQTCILGLVHRSALDPCCPHVEAHRRAGNSNHTMDKGQVRTLLQQQLNRSLDFNCTDLQIYGSRSMLFKVTLASHGYTVIAKGTRDVFVEDLRYEQRIYHRLSSMQGTFIPVHLGNIDLAHPWYDSGGVRVIHMLLLAYGGMRIDQVDEIDKSRDLGADLIAFQKELASYGVRHGDLVDRNILWNTEMQRLMFIDFERSTIDEDVNALDQAALDSEQSEMEPVNLAVQPKFKPCWLDIFHADEALCLPLPQAQEQQHVRTVDPTVLPALHDQSVTYPLSASNHNMRKDVQTTNTRCKGRSQAFEIYEDPDVAFPPSLETKEPSKSSDQRFPLPVALSNANMAKKQANTVDKENLSASVDAS
ncbi:MAG: hypothetical protein LQ344_007506 [Seirophora lacunosa]|nr:MAG: hypothetical protein LQ344_007506 [Seirophora lacunosa]